MIGIFELSISASLTWDEAATEVASALGYPVGCVVSENAYWGSEDEQRETLIGMNVAVAGGPFPTLVTGHCSDDVYGEALGRLAKAVAHSLASTVAVGDFIHDIELATGRFIVYFPDGSSRFGYEDEVDGEFAITFFPE